MAEGNGVDQGAIVEMLKSIVASVGRLEDRMGRLEDRMGRLEGRMDRLEGDVLTLRQSVAEVQRTVSRNQHDLFELRQEVRLYQGSGAGHGILISELDERIRRLEARA